jgi:hypothetical protein
VKTIILLLLATIPASAAGGIIYPPPNPKDQSCFAKSVRQFPWASQNAQQRRAQADCEAASDDINTLDHLIRDLPAGTCASIGRAGQGWAAGGNGYISVCKKG